MSIAQHLYLAVDRARESNCEAFQIFPGNPRGWKTGPFAPAEVVEFKERRLAAGLGPVVIHLPYLVNLAATTPRVTEASIKSLKDALAKAVVLDAEFLVMHPGSHGGDGADAGIERIANGLREVLKEDFGHSMLLLENTAGAGNTLGSTMTEIGNIIDEAEGDGRLGLCFDTCHAFAAGYDLATEEGLDRTLLEIDERIGLDRLKVIHANDCKGELGSRLDRHQHIGEGHIGLEGFARLVNQPSLRDRTVIIETPKKAPDDDIKNLGKLRDQKRG